METQAPISPVLEPVVNPFADIAALDPHLFWEVPIPNDVPVEDLFVRGEEATALTLQRLFELQHAPTITARRFADPQKITIPLSKGWNRLALAQKLGIRKKDIDAKIEAAAEDTPLAKYKKPPDYSEIDLGLVLGNNSGNVVKAAHDLCVVVEWLRERIRNARPGITLSLFSPFN